MRKIWGIGDVLYLHKEYETPIKLTVLDIGVYMTDGGTHRMTVKYREDNSEKPHYCPYNFIKELMDSGDLYFEGGEDMAAFLRKQHKESKT